MQRALLHRLVQSFDRGGQRLLRGLDIAFFCAETGLADQGLGPAPQRDISIAAPRRPSNCFLSWQTYNSLVLVPRTQSHCSGSGWRPVLLDVPSAVNRTMAASWAAGRSFPHRGTRRHLRPPWCTESRRRTPRTDTFCPVDWPLYFISSGLPQHLMVPSPPLVTTNSAPHSWHM